MSNFTLAVKCAPQEELLSSIESAGIKAVELYLSERQMDNIKDIISACKKFSIKYALHAPNDGYSPNRLVELADSVNAEIVVFHNIYWDDEWTEIVNNFKNIKARICIENTWSVHEPLKFMRRFGVGRCLDIEHLIMECAGIYEEEFIPVIKQASHIHLTGYTYGSKLWHTHIHHSPEQSLYFLNLLKKTGYNGLVVSESKISLQTYEEFRKLNTFYKIWETECH